MYTQPHPEDFARLLRHSRREAGLTQEELAERAGLAWRTISDLERGVKYPRRDTLDRLAEALGLAGERRTSFEAAARRQTVELGAAPAPAPLADQPTPLVGRTQEMGLLDRQLAGPGPPLLLLAGQPGIGKSRLLQEAATRAMAQGWRVLAGGCTRAGGQLPFAPLLQALQHHLSGSSTAERRRDLRGCAWLVRLLPELAGEIEPLPAWTLPPEQERRLLFAAVRRVLANVATPTGTLLLLDDLQWAGADACDLLASLVHRPSGAPLRVVGAYRDTDVAPDHPLTLTTAELAEAQLVTQQALRPLAPAEAQALFLQLRGELGRDEAALAAQVAQRSSGVPFFLVSYASSLGGEDGGERGMLGVPWDLRQSIQRRVTVLPEPGRALLAAAAVIGRVAPRSLLLAVLPQPERQVLDALEGACRAGVLEEVGEDSYGFVHDVIREVVEVGLGLARRRLLHRQVAMALERQPGTAEVEVLAYHFREAGEQARAVVYLEQAGDRSAARYAHAAAAAYYRDLVVCLEGLGHDADLARVLEKLGGTLAKLAQYDAALAALERAAALLAGDLDRLGYVVLRMAWIHHARGDVAAGLARLQPIAELLEVAGPSAILAQVYDALSGLLDEDAQPDRAMMAVEQAVTTARAVGERRIQAAAEWKRSYALLCLNCADEAVQAAADAVRLAEEAADPFTLADALGTRAWVHEERGEYALDRRCARRGLQIAERIGHVPGIIGNRMRLGLSAFLTGDWPQARAWLEQTLAFTKQAGLTQGHAYAVPRLDLGRLRLAEGAWDEAAQLFEQSLGAFPEKVMLTMERVAQCQLAERDVLAGNPASARARLLPLLDRPGVEERMVAQYILPVLAWAQLEAGEVDQAAATAADAIRRGHAGHCRLGLVSALQVQALVLLARDRYDEAACTLEDGLTVARSMPYPHGEGRLLQVYGLLHARQQEPTQASERAQEALAIFRRLGARKDVERIEQLMTVLDGHTPTLAFPSEPAVAGSLTDPPLQPRGRSVG